MGAKVRWIKGAWWFVTHHQGRRRMKRVGPTAEDKPLAKRTAERINAELVLGSHGNRQDSEQAPVPFSRFAES